MDYQEFLCVVEQKINQKLEGGVQASIHIALKNNGRIKKGIVIENPSVNISPTIYLEEFYLRFQKGESVECIVDDLVEFYEEVKYEKSWDTSRVECFDAVRSQIVFKIIHTKENEKLLETIPHKDLLDLSIVYYVLMEMKNGETATLLIRNEHLKKWKLSPEKLFPLACGNTMRLLPPKAYLMSALIGEYIHPDRKEPQDFLNLSKREWEELKNSDSMPMFVLTNSLRTFGAACMVYPGLMRRLSEILEDSYYILPCSVHELILLPDTGDMAVEELKAMVKEVNETQVEAEEQLSNSVYYYDRTLGEVLRL